MYGSEAVPRSSKQLARQHVRAGHGISTSCAGIGSGAKDSATRHASYTGSKYLYYCSLYAIRTIDRSQEARCPWRWRRAAACSVQTKAARTCGPMHRISLSLCITLAEPRCDRGASFHSISHHFRNGPYSMHMLQHCVQRNRALWVT